MTESLNEFRYIQIKLIIFVLFGFEVCGEWFCTTHHLKHFIQRFKQFFSSRNDTFPSDPDEQHWIKPTFRNPYLRKVGLKLKNFFRVSRSIVIATFFIGKGKVACDEAILNYHKLNLCLSIFANSY